MNLGTAVDRELAPPAREEQPRRRRPRPVRSGGGRAAERCSERRLRRSTAQLSLATAAISAKPITSGAQPTREQ